MVDILFGCIHHRLLLEKEKVSMNDFSDLRRWFSQLGVSK